ncbi:membrane protein [Naegleria gruberi]|uniref:Membrane protein n=1 Tax=Naegleria gruberi TaxID=5762 RepID=D2VUR5_NAEGR|nr:uncharacterized protein NAEGRDRAFT_59268 [Naegleria gruberi]EFC39500.1 membrane protein [Naegleria gruberi]|eukprot:XP_002672244.1 membrane protein [Naegleria gruberi strain NEG-M]
MRKKTQQNQSFQVVYENVTEFEKALLTNQNTPNHVLVLDVHATWCGKCNSVLSTFEKINMDYGDDHQIIFGVLDSQKLVTELNEIMKPAVRLGVTIMSARGSSKNLLTLGEDEVLNDEVKAKKLYKEDVKRKNYKALLETFVGLSEPHFLIFKEGELIRKIRGVNTPMIHKLIVQLLTNEPAEHPEEPKVDKNAEVQLVVEPEKEEVKPVEEEKKEEVIVEQSAEEQKTETIATEETVVEEEKKEETVEEQKAESSVETKTETTVDATTVTETKSETTTETTETEEKTEVKETTEIHEEEAKTATESVSLETVEHSTDNHEITTEKTSEVEAPPRPVEDVVFEEKPVETVAVSEEVESHGDISNEEQVETKTEVKTEQVETKTETKVETKTETTVDTTTATNTETTTTTTTTTEEVKPEVTGKYKEKSGKIWAVTTSTASTFELLNEQDGRKATGKYTKDSSGNYSITITFHDPSGDVDLNSVTPNLNTIPLSNEDAFTKVE